MKNMTQKKSAFLFQGVGPEYQKFLHLLNDSGKDLLKHYCSLANSVIGLDLYGYLFHDEQTQYDKMFNDWIAIYTCDYIVYQQYEAFGLKPDMLLGYSMGLITAMVCGQSVSYVDGLKMLLCIYEYPQMAFRKDEKMAVIVGMTSPDVEDMIKTNNLEDYVEIASENNEYCIIISGIGQWVEKAMALAELAGALKVRDVNAPYAFHSQHASKGIGVYESMVKKIHVADSEIPILSSFDQSIITKSADLKEELVKNMPGRMYWKTSIETAARMGAKTFVEVSLADYVTKYSKVIDRESEFMTYKKILKLRSQKELTIA